MTRAGDPISRIVGDELHQRLLASDITVSAEIAEQFLPLLMANLARRFARRYGSDLVETAVIDAMKSYLEAPQQYDPAKKSLFGYLLMSAWRDFQNLLRNEKRAFPKEVVELDAIDGEYEVEDKSSPSVEAQVAHSASGLLPRLQELLPNEQDQEMVWLMMEGVRETADFAALLKITHLPESEQAIIVKRHKDRLKKTLQRNLSRTELSE